MKIHVLKGKSNLSNTYLLESDSKEVIVIDPSDYNRINNYILDNDVTIRYVILTHEHWDHIIGLNQLREENNCKVISTKKCSEAIGNSKRNLSRYSPILSVTGESARAEVVCDKSEITFEDGYELWWNNQAIECIETEGHSECGCCILTGNILFSGDTLLENVDDIFRMPGANQKAFYEKTLPILNVMYEKNPDIIIYPGHGENMNLKGMIDKFKSNNFG